MNGRLREVVSVAGMCGVLFLGGGSAAADTVILPSSAFRSGMNGAEFRTDVRVLNQGMAAVTVTAYFYDQVTSTTWPSNPFRIEARNQAAFDNILQSLFNKSLAQGAYGPIRFESNGPILVGASVNNVNACGSGAVSGQWLPGIPMAHALQRGVIGQIAVSSVGSSGYRTNLVFVNPQGAPVTATVRIRRGGGGLLSSATIGPLAANGFQQVAVDGASFPGIAGTTDTNLWLEFTSDQPVIAYATVIHNGSGDPFAVIASVDSALPLQPALAIVSDTPDPSTVGQAVAVAVTVSGGGPTPTGIVTVSSTNTPSCQIALTAGSGTCQLTFSSPGSRTITASYGGDATYVGGVQTATSHMVTAGVAELAITSDSPDPSAVGQAVSVGVTVSGTGPVPTGTVAVTSADTTGCQLTLASGMGNCFLAFTASGPKTITATYLGDPNYSAGPLATTGHLVLNSGEVAYALPGGVPLIMVRIPAGTFQMGSGLTERGRESEETPHQVTLTSDYFLGKFEVTQAQWQAVMGYNPAFFASCGAGCPVERVSLNTILAEDGFIARLNQLLGTTKFRLPTEAEWERAARGGTQTRFSFGDALAGGDVCNANEEADPYLWWCWNAGGTTHPVGSKAPNQFGLYDMHGNVWEWVQDVFSHYPSTPQTDPKGPPTASPDDFRLFRGGGWNTELLAARSAMRGEVGSDYWTYGLGLRVAMSP